MTKYLRYQITNVEPIRIADDSVSQSGQALTLRYIPGSSMRGLVMNVLNNANKLETNKKILFSDSVNFLNAYPCDVSEENVRELLPSPKGFYEDKNPDNNELQNVVIDGSFSEGYKRAGLGRFCYLDYENNKIAYYNIATDSDLKIKLKKADQKQNVFRNEYIKPNHSFVGYVAFTDVDDSVIELVQNAISDDTVILGNARSQGLGKCKVISKEVLSLEQTAMMDYLPTQDLSKECYMMLLSHTTMRDAQGAFCGLDIAKLEQILGVQNLRVSYASTSVVDVRGYNRVWQTKIPSVSMYEKGSVFHLTFDGTLSCEKMKDLVNTGIGVRKNEGFGRVLFLKDYAAIHMKEEQRFQPCFAAETESYAEDEQVLNRVAKAYYKRLLVKKMEERIANGLAKVDIPKSQMGSVLSILENNKFDMEKAKKIISEYGTHKAEKEKKQNVQTEIKQAAPFVSTVLKVLNCSLANELDMEDKTFVMGIAVDGLLSDKEYDKMKIEYLVQMIKYKNKGGN